MNRLFIYRRLFWHLAFLSLRCVLCVYLLIWTTIVFGGYLPQDVCNTAAFTGSVSNLPASSSSEFASEILSAPYQLQEYRDNLVFQHQYALLSPRPELQNLAPAIKESIVRLDAFNPSFLDWSHKLSFFVEDLQTNHIVFSAHFDACLAFPKQRPRPFAIRVFRPLPEAFSILRGYIGPSLIPYYTHPTNHQVYKHLEKQYKLFRASSTEDLKALRSHPGSTCFNTSSQAIAAALQDARDHTTGKRNTLQLLHRDITANPSQAIRALDSLGWRWSDVAPHRLSQQPHTLNAIDHALTNAGAYIRKVCPFILRTEREWLELDARFDRVTAEDVFQGRGAVAMQRFDAQLAAVLLLPGKAGITEAGWQKIRERAERDLGIWRGGEKGMEKLLKGVLDIHGAKAEEARKEREL